MAAKQFAANKSEQAAFIFKERQAVIQTLAQSSRKLGKAPGVETEPGKSLLPRLDALLTTLAEKVDMTAMLRDQTRINEGLKIIFQNPSFHFPEEYVHKAKQLHDKWEAAHWGDAPPATPTAPLLRPKTNGIDDDDDPSRRSSKRRKISSDDQFVTKYPPKDHPIWETEGIMHGLALKSNLQNGRKTKILNEEYPKRNPKVFGHNGNVPGQWYPSQLSALFNGAHGDSQRGITGDTALGAYSIVVSGQYEDLDQDRGDSLYYSGSGSHDNTDPKSAAESTTGTKALSVSMETNRPVRVLRGDGGQSRWAPYRGIRYDGLYRVVDKRYPRNKKGGMYEQFELEREEGQVSLDSCRRRPSPKDLDDFERINNGFRSRR